MTKTISILLILFFTLSCQTKINDDNVESFLGKSFKQIKHELNTNLKINYDLKEIPGTWYFTRYGKYKLYFNRNSRCCMIINTSTRKKYFSPILFFNKKLNNNRHLVL